MLSEFKEIANQYFEPNDKILLGVSGGVDSMVMLRLFVEAGYSIGVAHCNYSLRGEESDGDMQLVERVCKHYSVPLHTVTFNTYKEIEESGNSLQMTARDLRYQWFNRVCEESGYNKISIAHNCNDTIETLFINMIRGTGIRGMAGIPITRDNIFRPLMQFTRCDIECYAIENSVEWRDDSSNSGTTYVRNKLRHNVIPKLIEIEDNFEHIMLGNIDRIEQANSFISSMISDIKRRAVSEYRGNITISLSVLKNYSPFSFVLYEIFSAWGFNSTVISELERCYLSGGSGEFMGAQYRAVLSRSLVILTSLNIEKRSDNEVLITGIEPTNGLSFEVVEGIDNFLADENIAYFDYSKIKFPLVLRYWREGDYFIPFGMSGRKKLSDFFVDNKVHLNDKDSIPILVDGDGDILWIVGMRSDNRYRVKSKNDKVLIVKYSFNNE